MLADCVVMSASPCSFVRKPNFYSILNISPSTPDDKIKAAYRRVILAIHPDKAAQGKRGEWFRHNGDNIDVDIGLIQTAYQTLSNPQSRAAYDAELHQESLLSSSTTSQPSTNHDGGPRPAEVVSLDKFSESTNLKEPGQHFWTLPCRCGSQFKLSEEDLEAGKHLVACELCSEVVSVGYEEADGDDAQEAISESRSISVDDEV